MVSGPALNRVKGRTIIKKIVYGSLSYYMGEKTLDEHTHGWKVYVKPYYDDEDFSPFIDKVQFRLHESYKDPVRDVVKPPYEINETGWGEFEIIITIHFVNNLEKPLNIFHLIRLFQPNCTVSTLVNKPLVSEFYDEIIFVEPPKVLCDLLDEMPFVAEEQCSHHTDWQVAIENYSSIMSKATEKVKAEIIDTLKQLEESNEKCSILKKKIMDYESRNQIIYDSKEDPENDFKKNDNPLEIASGDLNGEKNSLNCAYNDSLNNEVENEECDKKIDDRVLKDYEFKNDENNMDCSNTSLVNNDDSLIDVNDRLDNENQSKDVENTHVNDYENLNNELKTCVENKPLLNDERSSSVHSVYINEPSHDIIHSTNMNVCRENISSCESITHKDIQTDCIEELLYSSDKNIVSGKESDSQILPLDFEDCNEVLKSDHSRSGKSKISHSWNDSSFIPNQNNNYVIDTNQSNTKKFSGEAFDHTNMDSFSSKEDSDNYDSLNSSKTER